MKKRCLAALLALVMIVSVLPFSAFAVDGDALNGITYNDKTSAAATGVEANKTAVLNDDGTYTITLSVTGDTQTSTTTQKLPADIVLVVDTSTSMDEAVTYKTCGGRIVEKEGKNGHKKYVCELCEEDYEKEDLDSTCTEKVKDKNRLDVAKEAATAFVTGLFDVQGMDIRFGLCDFSGTPRTYVSLTNNEEALLAAIQNLHMPEDGDGTHYDVGLGSENVDYGAYSILKDSPESREKFIVFISDGEPSRGHSGVTEANTLKGMGVTIFSVGVDIRAGGNGETALRAICSKDENGNDYYYAASSNGESGTLLTDVLNQIKKEIESKVHAGKDAVMTDVINSNSFELVDGPLSEGLTLDQSGNIVWNIDDITKDTKTVTFKVRLKEDNTACGEIPTNADVNLTFTDASGNHVTFTKNAIGDPKVKVNKVTYTDGLAGEVFTDDVHYNYIPGTAIPSYSGGTKVPAPEGYAFDGWSDPVTDKDGNITITAVYKPDETQTKDLSATVDYKLGDDVQTKDHIDLTATVQVLQPDTLSTDGVSAKTYTGWKLLKITINDVEVAALPETVNNGDAVVYHYVVDDGQTKTLSYTVEYYKGGEKVDADTQTVTKTVQVLQPNTLEVDKDAINTTDKYYGYEFVETDPAVIPDTVETGAVIKVYYKASDMSLTVTKTILNNNKKYIEVGDTIEYRITIENTGNVTLYNVALTDVVRDQNGKQIASLRLYDKDGVEQTKIDVIRPGTKIELYAFYKVQLADLGKTLTNTVTALDPNNNGGGASSESIKVVSTLIAILPALNTTDHVAYIIGYSDGTVKPNNNITRAEVATIFFRLLTDESRAYYWSQTNDYSDVSADDWYNNAVSTMANAGIITGYPDGTFRPNEPITRAEFAAIAARFSDRTDVVGKTFSDVKDSHWAKKYISMAQGLGWITGYPDGTFKPDKSITRAEAMTMINRVLERAVESEYYMCPNMVTWSDNKPSDWFYEDVQEATNSHLYHRTRNLVPGQTFYYEIWDSIEKNPDWAALEKTWSQATTR